MISPTDEQIIGKTKESYFSFHKNISDVDHHCQANNDKPNFMGPRKESKNRTAGIFEIQHLVSGWLTTWFLQYKKKRELANGLSSGIQSQILVISCLKFS